MKVLQFKWFLLGVLPYSRQYNENEPLQTLYRSTFSTCISVLYSLRIAKLEDEVEKLKESYELQQQQRKKKKLKH